MYIGHNVARHKVAGQPARAGCGERLFLVLVLVIVADGKEVIRQFRCGKGPRNLLNCFNKGTSKSLLPSRNDIEGKTGTAANPCT